MLAMYCVGHTTPHSCLHPIASQNWAQINVGAGIMQFQVWCFFCFASTSCWMKPARLESFICHSMVCAFTIPKFSVPGLLWVIIGMSKYNVSITWAMRQASSALPHLLCLHPIKMSICSSLTYPQYLWLSSPHPSLFPLGCAWKGSSCYPHPQLSCVDLSAASVPLWWVLPSSLPFMGTI